MKLGWIGLGYMGVPMAKNLINAGYSTAVYNRTRDKELELLELGAESMLPDQMVSECDIIFTMLSDDEAVKDVYTGCNGLVSDDYSGKLIVNMSTISATTSKEMSDACKAKGIRYLEAPVSGSVKPAIDGTLIILVGGDASDLKVADPMFEIMGKLTMFMGEVGQGALAKLAINYYLGVQMQSLAETVLFAEKNGISKEDMLKIVNDGACGSAISNIKTAPILNNEFPAAFPLKHLLKDIRLANEAGLDFPLMQPLHEQFKKANEELGEEDIAAIIKSL